MASAVVIVAAALVAIVLFVGGKSADTANHKPLTAQQKEVLETRQLAASWVAHQVSRSVSARVACDPAMCTAIQHAGFPQSDLTVLGSRAIPPLSSAVVVETAYVRNLFGTSFNPNDAPAILAAFGTGVAHVEIRVIAADGAAAYQRQLVADSATRKSVASALLNPQGLQEITVESAQARAQMASGEVDVRVLVAIATLASFNPVEVIDFGNVAAGASQGVPLRYVDLAANDPAAKMNPAAYFVWMLKALNTAPLNADPYHYLFKTVLLAGGARALRVDFGAPTPLGLKQ